MRLAPRLRRSRAVIVGGVRARRVGDLEQAREEAADFARLWRLAGRDPRLPGGADQPADERQQRRAPWPSRRWRAAGRTCSVRYADRIAPRGNRPSASVPADVVDERAGGRIAARRVLLQRLHDDGVEVAPSWRVAGESSVPRALAIVSGEMSPSAPGFPRQRQSTDARRRVP